MAQGPFASQGKQSLLGIFSRFLSLARTEVCLPVATGRSGKVMMFNYNLEHIEFC